MINNNSSKTTLFAINNRSTRIQVIIMTMLAGLSGLGHGIPEILQGNKPTVDIATRIGAISLLPNYLITGVFAVVFSITIIVWVIGFIDKKYGIIIYLMLSIFLVLVGGGIAIIFGFLLSWPIATRIHKPLSLWRKIIPENIRKILAKLWLPAIVSGLLLLCIGISIWLVFATPGEVHTISITQYILWSSLMLGALFLIMSVVFGFARDIELQILKQ